MPSPSYTDELPLNSDARWVLMSVAAKRLFERLGSGRLAARDLHEALQRGWLHCMIRSIHTGERKLFEPAEWAKIRLEVWSEGDLVLSQGEYRGWTFYIWQPEFDALWPAAETSKPPGEPTATPSAPMTRRQAEIEASRRMVAEVALWAAPQLRKDSKVEDLWDACLKKFPILSFSIYRKRVWPIARLLRGWPAQATPGAKPSAGR
jgi:hypothetical protein